MRFFQSFRRAHEDLSVAVLRFGLGSLFLWFGIDKWVHPESWYGWIPGSAWENMPMTPEILMFAIGAFEFAIGVMLLAELRVNLASGVSTLYLLVIAAMARGGELTLRDLALAGMSLALFVRANAAAKRPFAFRTLSNIAIVYAVAMFVCGLIFLRSNG